MVEVSRFRLHSSGFEFKRLGFPGTGVYRFQVKQLQLSILEGMRDAARRCLSVWGLGFVVVGDLKDSGDLVIMIDDFGRGFPSRMHRPQGI